MVENADALGAVLELNVNGSRVLLQASELARSAVVMRLLLPYTVAVLDADALGRALIGEDILTEQEEAAFVADGQAAQLIAEESDGEDKRDQLRRDDAARRAREAGEPSREEQAAAEAAFSKRLSLFFSPKRRALERAKMEARRPLEAVLLARSGERQRVAEAAGELAAEKARQQFDAQTVAMIKNHDTGRPWRP